MRLPIQTWRYLAIQLGNTFLDGNLDVTGTYGAADKYRLATGIANGNTVIFENCPVDLDATLDPVLQRAIYKKGRTMFLQLAGEELEYDKCLPILDLIADHYSAKEWLKIIHNNGAGEILINFHVGLTI